MTIRVYDNNAIKQSVYSSSTLSTYTGIGCRVYDTSTTTLSGTGELTMTYDSEEYDTDGFFSPASSNIVIPVGLSGYYSFGCYHRIASASSEREFRWRVDTSNGYRAIERECRCMNAENIYVTIESLGFLPAGTTISTRVVQTSTIIIVNQTIAAWTSSTKYGMWCHYRGA